MSLAIRSRSQKGDFILDIDLQIPLSGVTAVFGRSGCGKTSLLRLIAGLDKSGTTDVVFLNECWSSTSGSGFVAPHGRRVGYVFQESSLLPHLDVSGNIAFALKRSGLTGLPDAVNQALEIGHLMQRRPDRLSGGEKQRVAIARALASNPRLLLLDEPVSALDAASKEQVLSCLQSLHAEIDMPIVYVSHSLDEIARLADRMVLLRSGRVIEQGDIARMLLHPEVVRDADEALEALVVGKITEIDNEYSLAKLEFDSGSLWVADQGQQIGKEVRARILARDISITLDRQSGTSIQNVVASQITHIEPVGKAHLAVGLQSGNSRLLAQITRRSADQLALKAGMNVFAQIKTVALLS